MPDELIKQIQSGNRDALDTLIRANYNDIYHFLCRKLPSYADAQDVTQTVFIKLSTSIYTYKDKGKFRNYLFRLAVNSANDFYRRHRLNEPIEDYDGLMSEELTPENKTEAEAEKQRVKGALQALPSYQRDVIILRFYHDFAFKDIAKITGANLSSTKSRYRQGIAKLKDLIKEAVL